MNEIEVGRESKYKSTPTEHLKHLLKIGYDPTGVLIKKYKAKHPEIVLAEHPNVKLVSWLKSIKEAANKEQVFEIVNNFRVGVWSDQDRAAISQTYIARLDQLSD